MQGHIGVIMLLLNKFTEQHWVYKQIIAGETHSFDDLQSALVLIPDFHKCLIWNGAPTARSLLTVDRGRE